ncbi:multicopper oxidase domain-containing protein [Streptomyces sp. DSM 44915]|uniref:Multicopper oxidase domain-containing protein n=1 Tax=Streptomyces chisholmiae TaxID=3075540 RepID=A0ABU2JY97_9ACTN|nr:multicopper oxidase domain-containing protein [Streptomyces sp. DSM 44915]MDT0269709.1 multicopper oxidase domain-containing protein [Streptomyces sp. DSM 44915]
MRRPGFSRRAFTIGAAAAALATPGVAAATSPPGGARRGGKTKRITLYAEELADGLAGYGLKPGEATIPGPLLEMYEGDSYEIELVNNLDVPVSLHVHGVDFTIDSDGTEHTNSTVAPGASRVHYWKTHAPGVRADGTLIPGSAGYWHYHDHVVGSRHGTRGLQRGLYGPLVVRRRGDVLPEKTFTVVFNDMKVNNLPLGPNFEASLGERVEFVVVTHGQLFHTFHLHGHRWADNRTGLLTRLDEPSRIIDTKTCGPADSFGFQVIAGEGVGPGYWMYHCHVQSHSDMGMVGMLVVRDADGNAPGDPDHHDADDSDGTEDSHDSHGSTDSHGSPDSPEDGAADAAGDHVAHEDARQPWWARRGASHQG